MSYLTNWLRRCRECDDFALPGKTTCGRVECLTAHVVLTRAEELELELSARDQLDVDPPADCEDP